jgi:hypothetical protein
VKWDTYPGGHDSGVPFQKNPRMLTDFFDQYKLDPYPKTVLKVVEHPRYTRAYWINCRLIKNAAAKATFNVRVLENNRIEVETSEEIASLDFDLCDKLIDMTKPVTVVCGEKVLFEGAAAAKISIKIRDGEPYQQSENKPLYQRLFEIRKRAGFEQ